MSRMRSRLLNVLKMHAVARLPNAVQRLLSRVAQRQLGGIEAKVRYGVIDWSKSKAYFDENPYYPSLRINLKGREPRGIVEPGADYEALRSQLIEQLEEWRHPETGEHIVHRAYRREDVYEGPHLKDAPDIVVHWSTHENYTYAFRVSAKSRNLAWSENLDPSQPDSMAFFTGKSGSHRDNGIFLAEGPAVTAGAKLDGARIIDVAPTILHLMNVPAPADMDGEALVSMLDDEGPQSEGPASEMVAVAECDASGAYTAEDNIVIAERLRALGYIE